MRTIILTAAGAAMLGACAPTMSQSGGSGSLSVPESDYRVWDGSEFQSFVKNYEGDEMCAILSSAADWDRVMAPAAVMNQRRAFAPPAEFWNGNAVYLISRVAPPGAGFTVERVQRNGDRVDVQVNFTAPADGSSQSKHVLMVALPKPAARAVTFHEAGRSGCTAPAR